MNIYVCVNCNTEISERLFSLSIKEKENHVHVFFQINNLGITKIFDQEGNPMLKKEYRRLVSHSNERSCTILDNIFFPNDVVSSR